MRMTPKFVTLALALVVCQEVRGAATGKGFELQFQSSPDELNDVALYLTNSSLTWLNGTLIRNGPALFEIGTNSIVTSTLDGLGKLSSWDFQGDNKIFFSTKFIRSTYRSESLTAGKFTSNIFFAPPLPPLTPAEVQRSQEVGIDNLDINIVRIRDATNDAYHYMATNDILTLYEINPDDLSTVRRVTPALVNVSASGSNESPEFLQHLATAHPLPEPGTDNLINVVINAVLPPEEVSLMTVVRVTSPEEREVIASIPVREIPLLHSFTVTEEHVVILMNPYIMNVSCRMEIDDNCFTWEEGNDPTTLYVVNIRTGDVQDFQIEKTFVYHHINGYQVNREELYVDVSAYDSPIAHTKFELPRLKDIVARDNIEPRADLKRITINLVNGTASIRSFDSPTPASTIASTLDYPVINGAYRSKSYCYVYGIAEKVDGNNIESVAVAKKDLCKDDASNADAVYFRDDWYPSEPTFVANPGATSEDDGILLVPYTSSESNRTSLVVLDAQSLQPIDEVEAPILIPQSQHGCFFPREQ